MANYLTAVVPPALEEAFRAWIAPHLPAGDGAPGGDHPTSTVPSGEHLVVDLPGTRARLHHVARGAATDLVTGPPGRSSAGDSGAVFHGYAHSADHRATVFGAPGVDGLIAAGEGGLLDSQVGREWEGSYSLVSWDPSGLRAHSDFFRLVPMLATAGGGLLAVSDSWQLLVRLRAALGLPVSVPGDVAAAQTLNRVIGGHPLDIRTLCAEVEVVGVGARLQARWDADGVMEHRIHQEPFGTVFAPRPGSWADQIRFGAISMASILRSHVDVGLRLRLSLSGGADSRAVLAAVRRADPDQDVTSMNTTNRGPANVRDAEVARLLADTLGLRLGEDPDHPARVERFPTPFQAWMVGSLGLHDRLGKPLSRSLPGSHYTLTGHGAGIYKSTYGWRPFVKVSEGLRRYDPQAGPIAARQAEDYLRSIGVDPAAPATSEWHFIAWRNSLHGGRSTLTNLLSTPLLMQRGLAALAHEDPASRSAMPLALRRSSETNGPRPNTSFTSVMLSLLDPELARLPFDKKAKDIDAETLDAILGAAGGPVTDDELVPMRTYGAPHAVDSGVARTFLSLAESWGQGVELEHEAIRPLVEQGWRIAEDLGLGDWYRPVVDRARSDLDDPRTLTQKEGSIAKLLSFLPLESATVVGGVPQRADGGTVTGAGDRGQGAPGQAAGSPSDPASPSTRSPGQVVRRTVGRMLPSGLRRWLRRRRWLTRR